MSVSITFDHNRFDLQKLTLPSRYFHFNEGENYVKLLSIGEGIFPKDRIKTHFSLQQSSCIVASESATKVYPSPQGQFGIHAIQLDLVSSNLEYMNDEMILFQGAKLIQCLHVKASKNSDFFYSDILTHGRSFEAYDFERMVIRNRFSIEGVLEYHEAFDLSKEVIKSYLIRHHASQMIFAKVYVKCAHLEAYAKNCFDAQLGCFGYTQNRQMLLGLFSGSSMVEVKKKVTQAWQIYRTINQKAKFHLGKW
ncbi:Urease accessory protein UreD [Sulfurospirillum diekertiae]|uniref:Urease accessory protein UreD n=1 Tax=Sulfurospirillum diekertiae TaxID=1854492 RepID=A0A290HVD2_9BACT|nr:urease accessory protein UreD [Sulfurospirillum diekertiae]ATB70604.1 Urease accessory protein UreD [Sulfurospirillum diekertiae]